MSYSYTTRSGKTYRIEEAHWPHYNYVLRLDSATIGRYPSLGAASGAAALHALESREDVPHNVLEWTASRW
jgi:hypothetical protein